MKRIAPALALALLISACQSSPPSPGASGAVPGGTGDESDSSASSAQDGQSGAAPAAPVADPSPLPMPTERIDPSSALAQAQEADACGAQKVRTFIGKEATVPVRVAVARKAGSQADRWITPDMAVTDDFSPTRLNVTLDRNNRIVAMDCG